MILQVGLSKTSIQNQFYCFPAVDRDWITGVKRCVSKDTVQFQEGTCCTVSSIYNDKGIAHIVISQAGKS